MKITSVTIIDHEGREKEPNRRTNLRRRIEQCGVKVLDYPFVWGEKENIDSDCVPERFVEIGTVNFVHSNNDCAVEFIDHVHKNNQEAWIVEYSGGGLAGMNFQSPKSSKHFLYPGIVTIEAEFPSLGVFLNAIQEGDENPFDALIGFDPILEAKLELLHNLLVPPSEMTVLKSAWELFERTLGAYPKQVKNLKSIQDAWPPFESGYRSEYNLNPFHPDYVALLSSLRDILLAYS